MTGAQRWSWSKILGPGGPPAVIFPLAAGRPARDHLANTLIFQLFSPTSTPGGYFRVLPASTVSGRPVMWRASSLPRILVMQNNFGFTPGRADRSRRHRNLPAGEDRPV